MASKNNNNIKTSFSVLSASEQFTSAQLDKVSGAEIVIDNVDPKAPLYVEKLDQRLGVVKWGNDNLFPQHLINIMHNSVEHYSIAKKVVDMTVGNGFFSKNFNFSINFKNFIRNNTQQDTLLDVYYKACFDLITTGCYALEVVWGRGGKYISFLKHIPVQNVRKDISNEEISGHKFSDNWSNTSKFKPIFLPSFDPALAVEYPSQIYFNKVFSPGAETYSLPQYFAGINWILLSHHISTFHLQNAVNGYSPSIVVSFKGEPETEIKKQIKDGLDKNYKGSKNAGNIILLFSANPDQAPDITTISPNQNDKQFEKLIEICTQKILNAWRVTDPSIMGIPTSSGFSNEADKMLVAEYRFQKNVIDSIQLFLQRDLNYLKSFYESSMEEVIFNKQIDEEKLLMLKDLFSPAQAKAIQADGDNQEDKNSQF